MLYKPLEITRKYSE